MDFRRLLATTTTKPVLQSKRDSLEDHHEEKHVHLDHSGEGDASDVNKPSVSTMTSVLASVNKMKLISQRSLAAKGNVTKETPLRKFDADVVAKEMENVLMTALKGVEYEPKLAKFMCKSLSDTIKARVKSLKFPRYKFIAMVTIGSKCDQSMVLGSRCLWNTDCDSFATTRYMNDRIVAVATVYAVFLE